MYLRKRILTFLWYDSSVKYVRSTEILYLLISEFRNQLFASALRGYTCEQTQNEPRNYISSICGKPL